MTGDPWSGLSGFRLNGAPSRQVEVEVAERPYLVELRHPPSRVALAGDVLFLQGEAWRFGLRTASHVAASGASGDGAILAPMPGRVTAVLVEEGQQVAKGQRLVILEAMKMEHALLAPFDGVVAALKTSEGGQVSEGALLAQVDEG